MKNFLLLAFFFFAFGHLSMAQSGAGTISAGAKIIEGQRIYSPNKSHYLVVQADGNLCVYTNKDAFVWCSMATKGSGSYLVLQEDGNLVVYDARNQASWASKTHPYFDPKYGNSQWKPVRCALENDGTLCLYSAGNTKVWSSTVGKINTGTQTNPIPEEGFSGPTIQRQQNIVLPLSKTAQNARVEIAGDKVIFERDMVLGNVKDFDAPQHDAPSWQWPNSTIPFVLPAGHTKKDIILAGISEINTKTNLCVIPRTNQADYVEFITQNGNWSLLGRRGGRQEISIDQAVSGTVAHEILHAAGFSHMQSREDRDNYVRINFGNIKNGYEGNFQRLQDKATNLGAYDFGSVMHYSAKAFSKNGNNTIDVKSGMTPANMGQRDGLSAGDIAAVASIYAPGGCKPGVTPTTATVTSPAQVNFGFMGHTVTFTAVNYPDRQIMIKDGLGVIEPLSANNNSKSFKVVQALNGKAGLVSFESVVFPGQYIRHQHFIIKLHKADGSQLFKDDASFKPVAPLSAASGAFSFETSNYPNRYIRHSSFKLSTDELKSNFSSAERDVFNKDVTYVVKSAGSPVLTNVSKGKSAKQSSGGQPERGAASKALDGNTSGGWTWDNNTITHTNDETAPWWEVDLGGVYNVSEIKIWNRTDECCWNRLQNFYVMVSETPIAANSTGSNQFVTGPLSFGSAAETFKSLKGNARGRYVRIFLTSNTPRVLSLAEVEVFGMAQ